MAVFLARGSQRLRLAAALATPRRRPLAFALSCAALAAGLLWAATPHGDPFDFVRLPLTPRTTLVFPSAPLGDIPGNASLASADFRVERARGLPALEFLLSGDRTLRREALAHGDLGRELLALRTLAEARFDADFTYARCGSLSASGEAIYAREILLERRELHCDAAASMQLRAAGDPLAAAPLMQGRALQASIP